MIPGARYLGGGRTAFTVWAPNASRVAVAVRGRGAAPMERAGGGCWRAALPDTPPGTRYRYLLDGALARPDPSSYHQPDGVHGASALVDHGAFRWGDAGWRAPPLEELVIYELHVGTFTREGTFAAIEERIGALAELGITAVEFMPVAQFPGGRNWGYDGVYPYAVQNSYGGPEGFKRIVDALHAAGIAAILDVVYNHLGPEGNYLGDFGPWSTDRYRTPYGEAVNFDGPLSDGVREFFIGNAVYWFERYHVDALRLDAAEQIYDFGARHFLDELRDEVAAYAARAGRRCLLIAESDLNDRRVVAPPAAGGHGLDAQWCDDFHHALHALLTGERARHYVDFGRCAQLAKAYREGFVYSGGYSAFRRRRHGNSSARVPPEAFVVFAQNHDQVGNRPGGERLAALTDIEGLKVAAGAVMVAPYLPLVFMGEEYGESAPFLYFTSHSDAALAAAVREGRARDEREWGGGAPSVPADPQDERRFRMSVPAWEGRNAGRGAALCDYYRRLIGLRRSVPALRAGGREGIEAAAEEEAKLLFVRRRAGESRIFCVFSFDASPRSAPIPAPPGGWVKLLDSTEERWGGSGATMPERLPVGGEVVVPPRSFTLYAGEGV